MNVTIPPTLRGMSNLLTEFFEGMVHKLHVNSHKDAIRDEDIDSLIALMVDELQEFKDQRDRDISDPNSLAELQDTANFCFLLYAHLRSKGVKDMRERFLDEFFDIFPEEGIILCKKRRAGSPLQPGDLVRGTKRNGVRYVRAQHSPTGTAVSLAIRDIIWWKHHGKWPVHPLEYIDRDGGDAIHNLIESNEIPAKRYPFVSRYCPKGRENNQNYGKWVYQRRHLFKLVRVGYYDSEEEAAVQGLRDWKEKTKNV